ncbi:MAG TPA: type I methionyl aminopeptidase [Spirochaetota bacterium]|nr:type I methionyl aminopeptidase [Spirochaetota bacterium]
MSIYIYNDEEIRAIEESCRKTSSVLKELEKIIDVGVSTFELDKFAKDYIIKQGGNPAFLGYQGFPGALCTSVNEVVVHGIPDRYSKLKSGDIIGIDVGVYYKGFFGDAAKTFIVGKVSRETELLLKVTEESLFKGIEQCIVGNRISDISHAVESHVSKFGFSPVREFVGHGIGKTLHEEPTIPNFGNPGKGARITEGMVFAIEPMINIGTHRVKVLNDGWTVVTEDAKLSAHFEHTVAIVEGKAKILTL